MAMNLEGNNPTMPDYWEKMYEGVRKARRQDAARRERHDAMIERQMLERLALERKHLDERQETMGHGIWSFIDWADLLDGDTDE